MADRVGSFLDRLLRKDVESVENSRRERRLPPFREFLDAEDERAMRRDADRQVLKDLRKRMNVRPDKVTMHPQLRDLTFR